MATREAEVPTLAPALTPGRPVRWPKRTRARLANGLEVVLAEAHPYRSFMANFIFARGMRWWWTSAKPCRNDGHGGAHGNGETREPAD